MDLSGRNILVIGLGKTGLAVARFLHKRGALPILTDEKPFSELKGVLAALEDIRENLEIRAYDPECLNRIDLIIPSPGVPPSNPLLVQALGRGIPIVSEIEVASRFLTEPIVAITGTNGKTTVTTLIGEILSRAGKHVFVGGNIGKPLIGCVDNANRPYDFIVAEVSSFQLQWAEFFRPHIAVLLNTTYDHIDYHGSFAAYRAAKEKIFRHQRESDLAVLNWDEPEALDLSKRLRAEVQFFSSLARPPRGIFLEGNKLHCCSGTGTDETYPADIIGLPGRHNIENVMAAVLTARKCGCTTDQVTAAVAQFKGIAHRIEYAGERRGIVFYDDSKGTNVGAVIRAIESFSRPIVLLLGGRDKGGDFEKLRPLIPGKVKRLVVFGEARDRIRSLVDGSVETEIALGLKEAVTVAYRSAESGDVVLLSPGCASFDEFSGYSERGDVFQALVRELPQ